MLDEERPIHANISGMPCVAQKHSCFKLPAKTALTIERLDLFSTDKQRLLKRVNKNTKILRLYVLYLYRGPPL